MGRFNPKLKISHGDPIFGIPSFSNIQTLSNITWLYAALFPSCYLVDLNLLSTV